MRVRWRGRSHVVVVDSEDVAHVGHDLVGRALRERERAAEPRRLGARRGSGSVMRRGNPAAGSTLRRARDASADQAERTARPARPSRDQTLSRPNPLATEPRAEGGAPADSGCASAGRMPRAPLLHAGGSMLPLAPHAETLEPSPRREEGATDEAPWKKGQREVSSDKGGASAS